MIIVTAKVKKGIDAARDSGEMNMFAVRRVVNWLAENGFGDAADWVLENQRLYSRGISQGFGTKAEEKKGTVPDVVAMPDAPVAVVKKKKGDS